MGDTIFMAQISCIFSHCSVLLALKALIMSCANLNKANRELREGAITGCHVIPLESTFFYYFLLLLRDTQGSKMLILHSLIILHYGEGALL